MEVTNTGVGRPIKDNCNHSGGHDTDQGLQEKDGFKLDTELEAGREGRTESSRMVIT